MRGLSVFSGIGGLDLAAEWAGIEPVAFCEIDSYCQKVLKKHWPGVPIFNDIFNLSGDDVGAVDIIYGGFPCQPFSVAGKQKGKSDSRHLWPEVARLVGEIKPRWCFFENVPGIIKLAGDDVCADLERLGYEVGVWNFEAAAVGANHRRARIAFIAHLEHPGIDMLQGVGEQGYSGAESKRRKTFESLRTGCTSTFVAHSRHELRERNANERERRETNAGGEAVASTHASSVPGFIPDSAISRLQDGWSGSMGRPRTISESERFRCDVSDSDSQRLEEQRDSITDRQGFTRSKCGSGRSAEPRLDRVDDGLPSWLDRDWWRIEPDIPRVSKGIKDRVNRLKALGNAVVPAWAYPIFMAIMEADQYA